MASSSRFFSAVCKIVVVEAFLATCYGLVLTPQRA